MAQFVDVVNAVTVGVEWLRKRDLKNAKKGRGTGENRKRINNITSRPSRERQICRGRDVRYVVAPQQDVVEIGICRELNVKLVVGTDGSGGDLKVLRMSGSREREKRE